MTSYNQKVQPVNLNAPTLTATQPKIGLRLVSWVSLGQGVLLFVGALTILWWLISATPGFVSNDDYYHARIADQTMEQQRLRVEFTALPHTILNQDDFVDHHLLFHLYLAPWIHYGGMDGAKFATALIGTGVFVATWVLLRGIGVYYPLGWTLLLLGVSSPFIYRLLMTRTQGAALLVLIITLHCLFQRQYRAILPLGFAFAWLYNGFVLLPAIVILYALAVWLERREIVWQPVVLSLSGVVLGLAINPYFPDNLTFISEHLGAKTDIETSVRVGNEWYPYTTEQLLDNSKGALILLAMGLMWSSLSRRRSDHISTTLLLVALLTLYMLFRSRRFIEYFPAFALLCGAAAWGREPADFFNLLPQLRGIRYFALAGVMLFAAMMVRTTVISARDDISHATHPDYLAGGSAWLAENTPAGSMVFQTDWDDFPYLYYHNTHNRYLVGLDPTYMQRFDSTLWDQWVAITQGDIENPAAIIEGEFGARYIISDTRHRKFARVADADPRLRMVYRDDNCYVWEVLPPPE